jgi:membrane associated rhomboid family serine protease
MIPLRDTISSRRYPFVTYLIMAVNVLVYGFQHVLVPDQLRLIASFALIPARFTHPDLIAYFGWSANLLTLLSYMFLHGDFLHLLGNMWSLYIFGDNVEDRLGPLRYAGFYLLAGIASGVVHLVLHPNSQIPTVGASGAIAGVMGAYFVLYPRSKILTLIPIFIFPWLVEIPAFVFLGIWFLLQFLGAAGADGASGGIAWWAHLGGFVAGIALLQLIDRLPKIGLSRYVAQPAARKHTHHLQMIHPRPVPDSPDLEGRLAISAFEALTGTRKRVALANGLRRRTLLVTIPAGIRAGKRLRLKGLGRTTPDGRRGDLYLRIELATW